MQVGGGGERTGGFKRPAPMFNFRQSFGKKLQRAERRCTKKGSQKFASMNEIVFLLPPPVQNFKRRVMLLLRQVPYV